MADNPLLSFGLPLDVGAWLCLALGVALLARARGANGEFARRLAQEHVRPTLGLLAIAAAALSALYAWSYLGGLPRVIDATAYLLEARLFAAGEWTFTVPEPTGAFRGRFLSGPDARTLGVIFPPGYPLLLALGVKLGAPQVIGPLLAGALVCVTYALGRETSGRPGVGLLAAAFSVLSATLRYHTADTMSHGWSALLATTLVWLVIRAARQPPRLGEVGLAGLLAGWLVATRPLTGLVFASVAALWWATRAPLARRARVCAFLLGALPPLGLLLLHQRALTGELFGSTQLHYYTLSDGPPGCFGLGLGKGCHFEHAPTVAEQGGGLSPLWALRNTLRRLHAHSLDLANFEPLALIVLVGWWRTRGEATTRLFAATALALVLAYSLFYFDGSYPGGGARFFAELLPLEHVGLASALRAWGPPRAQQALGVSLLGFACHGARSHHHLSTHMPGPSALPSVAGPAVVFVETDHDFGTHFEPTALGPRVPGARGPGLAAGRVLIARRTDPLRDATLLANLGTPPAFLLARGSAARLRPYQPLPLAEQLASPVLRLEAEAEWPLLSPHELWGHPSYPPGSCVSAGRGLLLHPTGRQPSLELDAGFLPPGSYRVEAVFWTPTRECFREPLGEWSASGTLRVSWRADDLEPRHLDRVELFPEPREAPPR